MGWRIRKVRDLDSSLEVLQRMDRLCFPGDDPYDFSHSEKDHHWWVVYGSDGEPAAYAGSLYCKLDKGFFLCRAGTLPVARGCGLQKKLIHARVEHAKRFGAKKCFTYTLESNIVSSNNLIKNKFLLYRPNSPWAGKSGVLYWYRTFSKS